MNLEKVCVKGFQAHRLTTFKLGHITTITGPSDVGKSSIIRALRWLVLNKPGGMKFINHNHASAYVSLQLDGKRVSREKGKGKNNYKLKEDKKIKTFKAFKNDIPSDVTDVLNMNELNFQMQFDSPYWFNCSAGEVSRQLNQIIDLGIIDQTLSNLANGIRKTKAEIEIIKSRYEKAQEKVRSLAYVQEMKKKFDALLKLEKRQQEADKKHKQLSSVLEDIEEQESFLENGSEIVARGILVIKEGERWSKAKEAARELANCIQSIEDLEEITHQVIPDLTAVEDSERKYNKAKDMVKSLSQVTEEIEHKESELWQRKESYETAKEDFRKQARGTCPLCNSVIK